MASSWVAVSLRGHSTPTTSTFPGDLVDAGHRPGGRHPFGVADATGDGARAIVGDMLYDLGMQLYRRTAVIVGMVFGLIAGCRGKSNPGGTGVGGQGGGIADGASVDGDAGQDASVPTCGETIDQYCQSDASTCLGGVARDWTSAMQQASSRCAESRNVFFQECVGTGDARRVGYGVLNAASVDDDTVFFYDLVTSMLVRVDHIQFGGSTECIAGVNLEPVDCSVDGAEPKYVCAGSEAGAN